MGEVKNMTSIYNNFNINTGFKLPQINFRGKTEVYNPQTISNGDSYTSSPINERYWSKTAIEASAKSNPKIMGILNKYNLPLELNEKELESLKTGHARNTRITAAKICSNLQPEVKNNINLQRVQTAALFHDIGKVFLPNKILNKAGSLTEKEREIVQQHTELGAELLKSMNIDEETRNIIKYHHQNITGNGYPNLKDTEYNTEMMIVSLADKYEALREKRSYKDAMSRDEALAVIEQDVVEGTIPRELFEALKASV